MKKNFLVYVMCFGLMIGAQGCGKVIKNVPVITGAGTSAYMDHDSIADIIQNNLDIFSPEELAQLKAVNKDIISVKEQIDSLVAKKNTPAELVMDLHKLMPLYKEAKTAYIITHDIIMNRIDEFNRQEQMVLYSYEATCLRLDAAITESLADDNGNTQTVRDILQFTLMVGKFLIPLLIL